MNAPEAIASFAALAHESRLAVFRMLVAHAPDGSFPSELATRNHIAPAVLSFHLKVLLHAGLVTSEQQGRAVRYRARIERVQDLAAYLLEHCCAANSKDCVPSEVCEAKCATDVMRSTTSKG